MTSEERTRSAGGKKRKYLVNDEFFDVIDTEEKAYFLGLLYADGYNNTEAKQVTLSLQQEDRELLEQLNVLVNQNRPLRHQKARSLVHKPQYVLTIGSKRISLRLAELGCPRKKTFKIRLPSWLSKELMRHFTRGYFDGDGCISLGRTLTDVRASIASNAMFCVDLRQFLDARLAVHPRLYIRKAKPEDEYSGSLSMSGNDAELFLYWIYHDARIYMYRKYVLWEAADTARERMRQERDIPFR